MTKQAFIKAIAEAAQKYAPKYGISVVSPCIAQACLESAYGTSTKAKYHNYFGLKYRKNRVTCNSGYFQDGSQEQKADGTYTPITDDWYAFDSLDSGVEGYYQFINISTYKNLKGVTDPKKYLELIKADGYATSINYVTNVYKVITTYNLTQYDEIKEDKTMGYTNSSLISYTVKSPNNSGTRTHSIDRITPHCVVGQLTAPNLGSCFTSSSVKASCNYGIGTEGKVVLCVDESDRSWCSSSSANDQRAVTIECASDKSEPYAMNTKVYNTLIELCVDICKRNGKTILLWFGDKTKTLNYTPKSTEMVLTVHRWFANKSCPGDWLYSRLGEVAETVTKRLGGSTASKTTSTSSGNTAYSGKGIGTATAKTTMNIRAGAGTSYKSLDTIAKGTSVEVLEVLSGWYKIVWPGATCGYAYTASGSSYYTYTANKTSSSKTTSSTSGTSAQSYDKSIKGYYKTTAKLNMRKGAGTNYDIILTIPKGKKVKNYGYYTEVNGVKWYYVTYSSQKGFVSSQYLSK